MEIIEPAVESEAFHYLASAEGPIRFARVTDDIYRGGQPDRKDLEMLHALGVRKIVNFRRENRRSWQQEGAHARELGMAFHHYPFYGVFGADEAFLVGILEELITGKVYVHCKHGRDRTSLLIALYRVMHEGWDPEVAWQREAIAYGSAQTYFYRQLRVVFSRMAVKYLAHQAPEFPLDAK